MGYNVFTCIHNRRYYANRVCIVSINTSYCHDALIISLHCGFYNGIIESSNRSNYFPFTLL